MNIVLFLGAGFSKPFGLPLASEFFSAGAQSTAITDEQKSFLRDLRKRTRDGETMIHGGDFDLEHILSYALMESICAGESTATQSSFDQIREVFGRLFLDYPSGTTAESMGRIMATMLSTNEVSGYEHNLTIVTTNYDLSAEIALESMGCRTRLPFDYSPCTFGHEDFRPSMITRRLYSGDDAAPLICKLHGSVNWFAKPVDTRPQVDDRLVTCGMGQVWPYMGKRPPQPLLTGRLSWRAC